VKSSSISSAGLPAVTLGRWIALLGGMLVIVAAAMGFPWEER
jgi:hypothetical protein